MLSLTNILLALTAFTATTLAAPTQDTNTITPYSSVLAKRADYHPAQGPDDDYCGEANPQYSTGANSPLASDCEKLYLANPGPGYWLITAAETKAKPDRWVRLASSGSCAFEVRLDNTDSMEDYRFGTNDVRFYIRSHATAGQGQDGRVEVRSGVWCRRASGGSQVEVAWRVVNSEPHSGGVNTDDRGWGRL